MGRWLGLTAVALAALVTAASLWLPQAPLLRTATAITAVGFWLLPAPLIRAFTEAWVKSDPLVPSDAAVVLGGGFDRRARAAAALYRRGVVRQVLVAQVGRTTMPSDNATPSESDRSRAVLIAAGVSQTAIAAFGKNVTSTYDEASAAAKWAAAHGAQRLIVPTDWYHVHRVRWVFRALAPPGVMISVVALPQPGAPANVADWSSLTDIARELVKYCFYRIRYSRAVREVVSIGPTPA